MSVIQQSKRLLRKDVMAKLHSLAYHVIVDQSLESLNVLKESEIYKKSRSVGIFMSMDTEIKTQLIIKESFDCGKDVYLPHIAKKNSSSSLHLYKEPPHYLIFYKMDNYESCMNLPPRGKYKLREPIIGEDLLDQPISTGGLDLLIMPGVAFTSKLDRLGHGGAFYDDFIKRHYINFEQKPYLLGIGLGAQLVDELPTEPHDESLDGLIIRNKFYGNQ